MTSEITSTLRVRIGQEEAHYGGNLVEGARMLKLFGDVITEIAVMTDGDEGLFVAYDNIEMLAPTFAGDYIEATGRISRVGGTSRTMEFEARKVVRALPEVSETAAEYLEAPIIVCRASGTCVTPREKQRLPRVRPAEGDHWSDATSPRR